MRGAPHFVEVHKDHHSGESSQDRDDHDVKLHIAQQTKRWCSTDRQIHFTPEPFESDFGWRTSFGKRATRGNAALELRHAFVKFYCRLVHRGVILRCGAARERINRFHHERISTANSLVRFLFDLLALLSLQCGQRHQRRIKLLRRRAVHSAHHLAHSFHHSWSSRCRFRWRTTGRGPGLTGMMASVLFGRNLSKEQRRRGDEYQCRWCQFWRLPHRKGFCHSLISELPNQALRSTNIFQFTSREPYHPFR